MAVSADRSPWVIVAGGFHQRGGMDRANAALASHLADRGMPVHLVGHEIDGQLAGRPGVTAHVVARPSAMPALAERMLGRAGFRVATRVVSDAAGARVVVNGGNCRWPDINWVHAVHAAWPVHDTGAPCWSRWRIRRLKAIARERELASLRVARIVIANSEATRRDVIERLGIRSDRVRTVYLGSDPSWGPAGSVERASARTALGLPARQPVVAFVGALGSDVNKGFDLLWEAWKQLIGRGGWDAHLIVAGGGWRLRRFRQEAAQAGAGTVHFLGITDRIQDVLAASDLLVSPSRYEAYGLNVHEALCRGVAVMVTPTAGVVERFDVPPSSEAVLPEGASPSALAARLRAWRGDIEGWKRRIAITAARIRARTWDDMAAEIVELVEPGGRRISA
jgi:glycosyltransferase involved in cell wall biosynthesis